LRDRRLTTALNVALLAIAVAMLVLLLQFARQAEERFLRDGREVDLVVGAKGSPLQLVLSVLLQVYAIGDLTTAIGRPAVSAQRP
jgi:putative ABC transport system permease protein